MKFPYFPLMFFLISFAASSFIAVSCGGSKNSKNPEHFTSIQGNVGHVEVCPSGLAGEFDRLKALRERLRVAATKGTHADTCEIVKDIKNRVENLFFDQFGTEIFSCRPVAVAAQPISSYTVHLTYDMAKNIVRIFRLDSSSFCADF